MSFFVHDKAICESPSIGARTRIWAFAHVLPGAVVGADCNICDGVFIEDDVVVGDRVTVKCGVQLWNGLRVEDDVFIGPNATFTNDRFPRSKRCPEKFLQTRVGAGASIGANATILPGLTIGANAMVGGGAVVTRSVPPNAIVVGNPARIVGYVDAALPTEVSPRGASPKVARIVKSRVAGVELHYFPTISDMRGSLTAFEFGRGIPFVPKRFFQVFDVPTQETRGAHAHHRCHQFLVAAQGSVSVVADDGLQREEFLLNDRSVGLYLPPMTWGIQYRYGPGAVLLVAASDYYDAADYIREYAEFRALKSADY
jgi:acetyltransferase-like isoleucine patch superfamily enzyme/dTDP-4-dehydrorhamnose 3,5-epimerase-like enzyme